MKLPNPLIIPATILLLCVTLDGFAGSAILSNSRIDSLITTRWSATFDPVNQKALLNHAAPPS